MIRQGVGAKTGRRMGHVSIYGPDGVLERLRPSTSAAASSSTSTTPTRSCSPTPPERREVEAAGFEVAYDGMEIRL